MPYTNLTLERHYIIKSTTPLFYSLKTFFSTVTPTHYRQTHTQLPTSPLTVTESSPCLPSFISISFNYFFHFSSSFLPHSFFVPSSFLPFSFHPSSFLVKFHFRKNVHVALCVHTHTLAHLHAHTYTRPGLPNMLARAPNSFTPRHATHNVQDNPPTPFAHARHCLCCRLPCNPSRIQLLCILYLFSISLSSFLHWNARNYVME